MLTQKIQVQKSMKLYCYCEIPGTTYIWICVIQKKIVMPFLLNFQKQKM